MHYVGSCAGFRTPAATSYPRAPEAGVRKAPRHEIAGGTLGRPCRWLSYGDLSGEHAACERERGEARKARIERLSVGREKNLCELTRAHPSGDDKDDRH